MAAGFEEDMRARRNECYHNENQRESGNEGRGEVQEGIDLCGPRSCENIVSTLSRFILKEAIHTFS